MSETDARIRKLPIETFLNGRTVYRPSALHYPDVQMQSDYLASDVMYVFEYLLQRPLSKPPLILGISTMRFVMQAKTPPNTFGAPELTGKRWTPAL